MTKDMIAFHRRQRFREVVAVILSGGTVKDVRTVVYRRNLRIRHLKRLRSL